MSLARTIAHNTFIQVFGKIISTTLGLVAIALMTRSLGAEQFGWYVTATGFLQFIGILVDFGFTVTTSNMLAEPEFEKTRLFNTIFTWRFLSALFFFGISPFFILFFPYPVQIKQAVFISSISFFAITLNQVFIGYYRQKLSMLIATLSEVLGRVVLVLGIFLSVYFAAGFLPMMGSITAASLVSTAYLWMKFGPIKFMVDSQISKALLQKMWPTAISVIFNAVYLQADRVILPLFISQSEVGLYGAAYRVLDIVIQIAALVMGMVMPLITFSWSRNLLAEFKERYQMAVDLLALLLFPMVVGIFILAEPVMVLIGGSQFTGSGEMLRWLSISILGTCFGMVFGHIVLAINRQKQALYIYGSDALLSLVGYFILIPQMGWQGAVLVTIFSEIYAGVLLTILSIYYSKTLPNFGTTFKISLASLGMGAALFFTPSFSVPILIIIGALIYSALIYLFGVIKKETLQQILRFKFAKV